MGALSSVLVILLSLLAPCTAFAETIAISCEKETLTVPEWKHPIRLVYEGGESGTLNVTAEHTKLSLAASFRIRPEDSSRTIDAAAETIAIMPDLAALDRCTAAKIPPDFTDDADFYNVTSMSCLGAAAAKADPVRIKASVRIGILPTSDIIVEMTRTYLDPSAGPGGIMYVETYPVNCKLDLDPT